MKSNRKIHITLSMPCDIYSLSDIQFYVWSHFKEVSTETKSDVASGKYKGAKIFHAGQVAWYTSTMFIRILEITLREMCVTPAQSDV